jgi:fructokinase
MSDEILCVGEILWDALPDGLFLGGAPFNVASHLRAHNQEVVFASRVGDDRLGHKAIRP